MASDKSGRMRRPAPASDPRLDELSDGSSGNGNGNGRTRVRVARPSEPLRPPENPLDRFTSLEPAHRSAPAFPGTAPGDRSADGDGSPNTAEPPVVLAPPRPPLPAPVEQPAVGVVADAAPMRTEALPVIAPPAPFVDAPVDDDDPQREQKVERVLEPLARLRAGSRPVVFPTVRRPRVRRVTRVVRHVDTWSIFKVAFVFNLVLYVVCLTAGVLLWNVAYSTGTIDNIENFFEQFGWESFEFRGGELYHNFWVAGLFVAVALTGLAVLLATLFNLITDLVGGVRVTVLEEEVVARSTSRSITRPRRAAVLAPAVPDRVNPPVGGGG